jgi:hypothetical protein
MTPDSRNVSQESKARSSYYRAGMLMHLLQLGFGVSNEHDRPGVWNELPFDRINPPEYKLRERCVVTDKLLG